MPKDVYRLVLRDYLYELRERATDASAGSDYERGYAMAVQNQLGSLENQLKVFGIDADALIRLDDV